MQQPNECFFCAKLCRAVICDGCVASLAAHPEVLAATAEVVAVPFAPVHVIDRKRDRCKCGRVKLICYERCRKCGQASRWAVCGRLKKTGVCERRTTPGLPCGKCRRSKTAVAVPVPVEPMRIAEATACMASLLVSMARRSRGEVRV